MKHIDIIATIGPSSYSYNILKQMKADGMTIGRINTKYGSKKQYEDIEKKLKKLRCKIIYDIKGLKILDWLKTREFDYLAVSFTESAAQIKKIRKIINKKIISKIETKKGIKNIKDIIDASDGVMVARGDLGKNTPMERLPIFQKLIIKECNKKKKMAITATEMLLSMTKSKIPERAEVSDVANAVLDGSDAVMLSEETAIGRHPVLTVRTMHNIIKETVRLRYLKL